MPAINWGTDFKGNTSSAVARPPLAGRVGGVFSRDIGSTSSIVAPVSVSSVEMVDWKYPDLYGQNTLPRYPVKMRCWYWQGLSLLFPGPHALT